MYLVAALVVHLTAPARSQHFKPATTTSLSDEPAVAWSAAELASRSVPSTLLRRRLRRRRTLPESWRSVRRSPTTIVFELQSGQHCPQAPGAAPSQDAVEASHRQRQFVSH